MKRNNIKKPLILGGIVALVLITVSAVIAFRHFPTPSELILHEDVKQQAPVAAVEDKPAALKADNRSSSNLSLYKKTVETFSERLSSEKHENDSDSDIYIASSNGINDQKNTFMKEEKKYYREERVGGEQNYLGAPAVTQEANSKVRSASTENREGISTSIPLTRKSADYIPQNDSAVFGEPGNDSPFSNDEDFQEKTQDVNYNVSVSRYFISGSVDEGEIDVVLSVDVDSNAPNGLIVKENIPEGWDVVESTPAYKNYNASSGEMKWLFIGADVGSMEINYRIVKKDSSSAVLSFHGNYLYKNPEGDRVAMQIAGSNGV